MTRAIRSEWYPCCRSTGLWSVTPRPAGRPAGLLGRRPRHGFGLEVLVEAGEPVLAADPAVLVPPEGHVRLTDRHASVDGEGPRAHPLGDGQRALQRSGEHAAG